MARITPETARPAARDPIGDAAFEDANIDVADLGKRRGRENRLLAIGASDDNRLMAIGIKLRHAIFEPISGYPNGSRNMAALIFRAEAYVDDEATAVLLQPFLQIAAA